MTDSDATGSGMVGSDDSSGPESPSVPVAGADRDPGALGRAGDVLERVRTEPRPHAAAVIVAVGTGLVLSWLHWIGLVVGGALVALTGATLWRGVAGAIGFGVLVLVAFALSLGSSAWTVLEMTPVVYLVVASALGLPLLGSLARGIV